MDTEQAIELVRQDVNAGVGSWLPAASDLEVTLGGNVGDSAFVTVRWVHRGRNEAAGEGPDDPFIGLARDGAEVEVHGVTLVEDRGEDEPLFHRFVDWVGVYDQLGLAVSGRLVVSEHPGHIGVHD